MNTENVETETPIEGEKSEQTLLESQMMLSLAMQFSRMGAWEQDIATEIVYWSDELEEIFGLEKGAFGETLASYYELIYEDDHEKIRLEVQNALEEKRAYSIEFRFFHSDGTIRWMEGRGQAVYSEKGEAIRVYGIGIDITERKQRELNLAFLANLQKDFASLSTAEEIITTAGMQISEYLNLDHCLFVEINDRENEAFVFYDSNKSDTSNLGGVYQLTDYHTEAEQNLLSAGKTVVINDVRQGPRTKAASTRFETLGIKSAMTAPYVSNERWRFVLSAQKQYTYNWREDEVTLLTELAGRIYIRIERARAELQLRQSEERFRTLFNSIDEGFCIVEVLFNDNDEPFDYRFVQLNPAMERLTGMENAVGKTARELVPDLEDFWIETYGKVVLTGESIRFENKSELMNRWFEVYASRVGDAESRRVALVFNNINERKQFEENLRESEERFRNMADNISQFAWMADETGSLFWYNRRWYEYTGTTFDEMQGWGWKAVHHPNEVERVTQKFKSAVERGEPWEDTFPLRSKTGDYGWFLSRALPIRDDNGKVVRWFGTNTDITELRETENALRESEQRFRGLQQATPDGFMIFDSVRDENRKIVDFRWLYVNPAAEKIIGFGENNLVGKNLLEIMPGNRDEGLFDAYVSVVETGELWQQEFHYIHENLDKFFHYNRCQSRRRICRCIFGYYRTQKNRIGTRSFIKPRKIGAARS